MYLDLPLSTEQVLPYRREAQMPQTVFDSSRVLHVKFCWHNLERFDSLDVSCEGPFVRKSCGVEISAKSASFRQRF